MKYIIKYTEYFDDKIYPVDAVEHQVIIYNLEYERFLKEISEEIKEITIMRDKEVNEHQEQINIIQKEYQKSIIGLQAEQDRLEGENKKRMNSIVDNVSEHGMYEKFPLGYEDLEQISTYEIKKMQSKLEDDEAYNQDMQDLFDDYEDLLKEVIKSNETYQNEFSRVYKMKEKQTELMILGDETMIELEKDIKKANSEYEQFLGDINQRKFKTKYDDNIPNEIGEYLDVFQKHYKDCEISIKELDKDPSLKIDNNWYYNQMINFIKKEEKQEYKHQFKDIILDGKDIPSLLDTTLEYYRKRMNFNRSDMETYERRKIINDTKQAFKTTFKLTVKTFSAIKNTGTTLYRINKSAANLGNSITDGLFTDFSAACKGKYVSRR